MNFILWVILGAIAGWLASLITRTSNGILMDIVLGIVGALVGGFIMNLFGFSGVTNFNLYSLLVAVVGAIVLISIGKFFQRRF